MPDEGAINKDFLKEVFAGKKQLLRKQELSYITVPQYDEISVKALWPELKKDGEFMLFFPSVYPKNKGPPREYFFNLLNTLKPEYLAQVLEHANSVRMAAGGPAMQNESIAISQFWEEQLKAMPYLSSKCLSSSTIWFLALAGSSLSLARLLSLRR